jgi:PAS domain S-box-containing protein
MKRNEKEKSARRPVALPDFINKISDGVLLLDRQRSITYINAISCRKTGYRQSELLGKKLWLLFPEKQRARYTAKILHFIRVDYRRSERVELRTKGGAPIFADLLVIAMRDAEGKVVSISCLFSKFSTQPDSRTASASSIPSDYHLFDSLGDGVAVCDQKGTIEYCNGAYAAMLRYDRQEIIGRSFPYPWVDPADRQKFRHCLKEFRGDRPTCSCRLVVYRRDATPIIAGLTVSKITGAVSGKDGFVVTMRDVTETHGGDELRRANEQLHRFRSDVQRKAERLQTLEAVNSMVLKSANLERVFKSVVAGIKRLVPHDLAGVYVFDSLNNCLFPHTLSKVTAFSRRLAKFPLRLGEGIIGAAAVTGEHVIVNNAQLDPRSRYPKSMKPAIEHFIAVPLRGRSSTFGVLVVARNSAPEFIEEEAVIVKSFASATTVALENARLTWQIASIRQKYPSMFAEELTSPVRMNVRQQTRRRSAGYVKQRTVPIRTPKRNIQR